MQTPSKPEDNKHLYSKAEEIIVYSLLKLKIMKRTYILKIKISFHWEPKSHKRELMVELNG